MKKLLPLLLLSCTAPTPTPEATPTPQWGPVRVAADEMVLEGPALVLTDVSARGVVTPPFRATVTRIAAREGDVVDAGAPLCTVVMPEVLDAAGRAEGARARLAAWTERHQQLTALKAEGLAKSLDVSEAAAQEASARADLQTARAVLLAAGVRDSASLLSGSGELALRAPSSGVVTHVDATLGENRDPSAGPLFVISGRAASRIEARLSRPAPDGEWRFVVGAEVTPVRLVSRAPAADPRDGSFLAWFEAEDSATLTAGTPGRVTTKQGGEATFLVPASAIRRDSGLAQVRTRNGLVSITVKRCEERDCLVTGALRTGDEVER